MLFFFIYSANLTELPVQCCLSATTTPPLPTQCTTKEAITANVTGCHDKIVDFANKNMKLIMYISIAAIVLQVSRNFRHCFPPTHGPPNIHPLFLSSPSGCSHHRRNSLRLPVMATDISYFLDTHSDRQTNTRKQRHFKH